MIFWRQRVMYALLDRLPSKKATRIQLVKLLFLMREEERIDRHGAFYDFVPYKFGPFSFVAYRDISGMANSGLIYSSGDSFQIPLDGKKLPCFELPSSASDAVDRIVGLYGRWSQNKLLEYIYKNYPWFASRSKMSPRKSSLAARKHGMAVWTIGYEGLSIDSFLAIILKAGIQSLIDLRKMPFSRKYGFSRDALSQRCIDFALRYYQFPEVGISSELRKQFRDKSALWNTYSMTILPKSHKSLKSISDICQAFPSVLLCFEKHPYDCHRHIVAREVRRISGLPIFHYDQEEKKWARESKS